MIQQLSDQVVEAYLDNIYNSKKMTNQTKIVRSIQEFVKLLQQIRFQKLDPPLVPVYYQYFGSFLNGFATQSSDIDFTILTNSYVDEFQTLRFVKQEIDYLNEKNKSSRFKIERFVSTARIPVIKIKDEQENVDYDLCCNNILGVINTKLLKQYSMMHEKVCKVGILLKIWGKNEKLISQNDFSSYAIILMWLYFLQRKHNLPNLQDPEYLRKFDHKTSELLILRKRGEDYQEIDDKFKTNTRFMIDEQEIRERMKKCTIDDFTCAQLLKQFWNYYSFKQEHELSDKVIAIHNQEQKNVRREHLFQIKDPFDISHDPGQRVKNIKRDQQDKFEYASVLLGKRDDDKIRDLFEKR